MYLRRPLVGSLAAASSVFRRSGLMNFLAAFLLQAGKIFASDRTKPTRASNAAVVSAPGAAARTSLFSLLYRSLIVLEVPRSVAKSAFTVAESSVATFVAMTRLLRSELVVKLVRSRSAESAELRIAWIDPAFRMSL